MPLLSCPSKYTAAGICGFHALIHRFWAFAIGTERAIVFMIPGTSHRDDHLRPACVAEQSHLHTSFAQSAYRTSGGTAERASSMAAQAADIFGDDQTSGLGPSSW